MDIWKFISKKKSNDLQQHKNQKVYVKIKRKEEK